MWQISFNGVDTLKDSDGTTITVTPQNALVQARAQYRMKYRDGYYPPGPSTPPMIKAMKSYEYTQGSIKSWPVWTQPKLHGMRLLCQDMGGGTIAIRSSLNNPQTHLAHMESELKVFMQYLPRYCVLDMEAYTFSMNFSTLISAMKTAKTTHPRLSEVQCHIFDVVYEDSEGAPYEIRYNLLVNAYSKYLEDRDLEGLPHSTILRVVPCQVAATHHEVMAHHAQYVREGYEGVMIKKLSLGAAHDTTIFQESLYKQTRCNHTLKYKAFDDEEATILDAQWDAQTVIYMVQDRRGNQFRVTMRAPTLQQSPDVVGKLLTYRYQGLSSTGVPLEPVGIIIRDYE